MASMLVFQVMSVSVLVVVWLAVVLLHTMAFGMNGCCVVACAQIERGEVFFGEVHY